jgi:hypothetical protein
MILLANLQIIEGVRELAVTVHGGIWGRRGSCRAGFGYEPRLGSSVALPDTRTSLDNYGPVRCQLEGSEATFAQVAEHRARINREPRKERPKLSLLRNRQGRPPTAEFAT